MAALDLTNNEDLARLMAVGMLAVFLRTLSKRSGRLVKLADAGWIDSDERKAFRGYFLHILRFTSLHFTITVSDGRGEIDVRVLLQSVVKTFMERVMEVSKRLDGIAVHPKEAKARGMTHVQPAAVRNSLRNDLFTFWPRRKWKDPKSMADSKPKGQKASKAYFEHLEVARPFIDVSGYTIRRRSKQEGQKMDWTEFGIKELQ